VVNQPVWNKQADGLPHRPMVFPNSQKYMDIAFEVAPAFRPAPANLKVSATLSV